MMDLRAPALVAVAAIAMGCSSLGTPDLQVPLEGPGRDAYALLVYDDTGLVTAVTSRQRLSTEPTDAVLAFPERNELELYWIGGACSHRPTLGITGDSKDLLLSMSNPNDPNWLPFLPLACPAVGVPLMVTITLSEPVTLDAVGVVESY